jgi:hypothetical protein
MWTFEDWLNASFTCAGCGWSGNGGDARLTALSAFDYFLRCPKCDRVMDALKTPTIEEAVEHWSELDDDLRAQIIVLDKRRRDYLEQRLERADQLPELSGDALLLTWDLTGREGGDVLIKHGDRIVWREPASYENYERFKQIAALLTERYGPRLMDLVPTQTSELFLYGDRLSAPYDVEVVRQQLRANHAARQA